MCWLYYTSSDAGWISKHTDSRSSHAWLKARISNIPKFPYHRYIEEEYLLGPPGVAIISQSAADSIRYPHDNGVECDPLTQLTDKNK